jgi:hypothetical protein
MLIYPMCKYTPLGATSSELKNLDTKITDTKCLSDYYQNKCEILHFDTDEGVFEIVNNRIYKLNENRDYECFQFSKEISLNLHSEEKNRKETFYLPLQYTYKKMDLQKYKLTPTSLLTLILENNKKVYFETNENEITESIKEDLITFLSLLKIYK